MLALLVLVLADNQDPFILSGVSVSDSSGSVPLRREISELQAEGGAQWFVETPFHILPHEAQVDAELYKGMCISEPSRLCKTKATLIPCLTFRYLVSSKNDEADVGR